MQVRVIERSRETVISFESYDDFVTWLADQVFYEGESVEFITDSDR